MSEVSRPIIAITLVLCAVFIPVAFVEGLTGQFYRQFALTIAISTVISAFNSLTLSPALAALLLKPHGAKPDVADARHGASVFGRFFARFNTRLRPREPRLLERALGGTLRKTRHRDLRCTPACSALTAFGLLQRARRFHSRSRTSCTSCRWSSFPPARPIDRTEAIVSASRARSA